MEPDPNVTQVMRRQAPLWGWLRETITAKVAISAVMTFLTVAIGTAVTAIVQFRQLRSDLTELKDEFKASKSQGEAIAALNARVAGLEEIEKERRAWVDRTYAELPPKRRR